MMSLLDRALSKIKRVGKKDNNDDTSKAPSLAVVANGKPEAKPNGALSASTYSSDVLNEDGEKLSKNQV